MSSSAPKAKARIPRIAITPGEPAGIGPDIVLQLALHTVPAELVVIADPDVLRERAASCGISLEIIPYRAANTIQLHRPGTLNVYPIRAPSPVQPGHLSVANASYVLATLDAAITGCMSGEFRALVTGPVQKSTLNDGGYPFTGHTEYLALRAGDCRPVMMLINDDLRVALVTTHLPLRAVADAIDIQKIVYVIRQVEHALKTWFKIARPRIAVCGLNPHAGEGGHLGTEDIQIIQPAVAECQRSGSAVTGPLPADTAFTAAARSRYDAIVCMYHDQGLPALKALGFGHAVNITLGLPFVRTSVDHGTALDKAGSGQADASSLRAAIELALRLIDD